MTKELQLAPVDRSLAPLPRAKSTETCPATGKPRNRVLADTNWRPLQGAVRVGAAESHMVRHDKAAFHGRATEVIAGPLARQSGLHESAPLCHRCPSLAVERAGWPSPRPRISDHHAPVQTAAPITYSGDHRLMVRHALTWGWRLGFTTTRPAPEAMPNSCLHILYRSIVTANRAAPRLGQRHCTLMRRPPSL